MIVEDNYRNMAECMTSKFLTKIKSVLPMMKFLLDVE